VISELCDRKYYVLLICKKAIILQQQQNKNKNIVFLQLFREICTVLQLNEYKHILYFKL